MKSTTAAAVLLLASAASASLSHTPLRRSPPLHRRALLARQSDSACDAGWSLCPPTAETVDKCCPTGQVCYSDGSCGDSSLFMCSDDSETACGSGTGLHCCVSGAACVGGTECVVAGGGGTDDDIEDPLTSLTDDLALPTGLTDLLVPTDVVVPTLGGADATTTSANKINVPTPTRNGPTMTGSSNGAATDRPTQNNQKFADPALGGAGSNKAVSFVLVAGAVVGGVFVL